MLRPRGGFLQFNFRIHTQINNSSKCISHPGNYQYFFQMYQPSHKLSIISPTSTIPETINNSSEMHQYFPSTRSHPSCSLHTQTPAAFADGVIVGSAIVKIIAKYGREAAQPVFEYVKSMKDAIS